MLRKLFKRLKDLSAKPKLLNSDLAVSASTESLSRVDCQRQAISEYSDLYQKIIQSWIAAGISRSVIPAGKKLFSGQSNQEYDVFDHSHNAKQYGFGMWLTEGLSYAKDYCYFNSNLSTKGRILFEVESYRDIAVIEFQPNYHPASEINKIVDGLSPDAFVSKHWDSLLNALVEEVDSAYRGVKGHIRKQNGCSLSSLGVAHDGLIEVWVNDPSVFKQISATNVPKSKDEFWAKYGTCSEMLPRRFFIN